MNKLTSTLIIVILILVAVLFIQRCNTGKYIKPVNYTIRTVDTVYNIAQGETKYIPKPYKVEVPVLNDTLIYIKDTSLNGYKEAYKKILFELQTKCFYDDTINVDTNGLNGYINIVDTVYKNKLQGRAVKYDIKYPSIKETITVIQKEKRKTLWFAGGDVLVNYPLKNIGIEINTGFLNKKHQYYQIGVQSWNNELIYKMGTKIKL